MVHRAWPFPVGSRDRVAWTYGPTTDADLMAIEIARGKRYFPEWNTGRWWMSHEAYSGNRRSSLSNFESGLRIFADHGIGVVAVLFNRWRDTVCRRHMKLTLGGRRNLTPSVILTLSRGQGEVGAKRGGLG